MLTHISGLKDSLKIESYNRTVLISMLEGVVRRDNPVVLNNLLREIGCLDQRSINELYYLAYAEGSIGCETYLSEWYRDEVRYFYETQGEEHATQYSD